MNRNFAKTKRQFNYLIKRINKLIHSDVWQYLSNQEQQNYIKRLHRLYARLAGVFRRESLLKAMGVAAVVLGIGTTANAQSFAAPTTNPFGLTNTGSYLSMPTFADLDGDGDLDVITTAFGYYSNDVLYYENTGTNKSPSFASSKTDPFGLKNAAYELRLTFADLDNDGDLDLMKGDIDYYSSSHLVYFQNTGNNSSPQFGAGVSNPFGITPAGLFPMPVFVDLDNDGDMDIMIGTYYGDFHYYKNTGTKSSPAYAAPSKNPFGLTSSSDLIVPDFADIDNDGDLDMICSEYYGDFLYFENKGSATAPSFGAPLTNPFNLANVGSYPSFLCTGDLDGDGDQDIVVGEYYGDFKYYKNNSPLELNEQALNGKFDIYPNPASTEVNIEFEEVFEEVNVRVWSLAGSVVFENNYYNNQPLVIGVSHLDPGIYFVHLLSDNKSGVRKLIIE